jgi:hypothetical protein
LQSSVSLRTTVQSAYIAYTAESSSRNSKTSGTIITKSIDAIAADTQVTLRQFGAAQRVDEYFERE